VPFLLSQILFKKMKLIFNFLVIFTFFSCNQKESKKNLEHQLSERQKKEQSFGEYFFDNSKTISFTNKDRYFYSFLSYYNSNNIYRKRLRSGTEGIDILNIDSTKSKKELLISDDHQIFLRDFRSFYVQNSDSIFLHGINLIQIVDSSGEIIFEKNYEIPIEIPSSYFPISNNNSSKSFLKGYDFYFTRLLDMYPNNEMYNSNTLMRYNLVENKLYEVTNTNYPKFYFDNCWFLQDYTIHYAINDNDEIVYSFPIDDYIYIYSLSDNKIVKKINCKSKYKEKNPIAANCDKLWDAKSNYKHTYESFLYGDVVFDPKKYIYYRFAKIPETEYSLNQKFDSKNNRFIIMVLDQNFNLIHESKIYNKTPLYLSFDYFVTDEGLWISTNNPSRVDYDEDILSFELFNFKAK